MTTPKPLVEDLNKILSNFRFNIFVLINKAQQSLCHLEKVFLTEDLATPAKGKVTIY